MTTDCQPNTTPAGSGRSRSKALATTAMVLGLLLVGGCANQQVASPPEPTKDPRLADLSKYEFADDCTSDDFTSHTRGASFPVLAYPRRSECGVTVGTKTYYPSGVVTWRDTYIMVADPALEASRYSAKYGSPQEYVDGYEVEFADELANQAMNPQRLREPIASAWLLWEGAENAGTFGDYLQVEDLGPRVSLVDGVLIQDSGAAIGSLHSGSIEIFGDDTLLIDFTLSSSREPLGKRYEITMPDDIIESNGTVSGRTAVWESTSEGDRLYVKSKGFDPDYIEILRQR